MQCETCDELLALYDTSVRAYSKATSDLNGALGDDFRRLLQESQTAFDACQKGSDKLMDHWRSAHKPLAVAT